MIGLVQLDLGAAEIGQPRGRAEWQRLEFGMGRVDDFDPEIDGVFRRLAGARRIAGERINHTDFDVLGGPGRADGKRGDTQDDGNYGPRLFHHFLPEGLARLTLITMVKSIPLTRTKLETL